MDGYVEQKLLCSPVKGNIPAFLAKLWRIVEDEEYDSLISWNENGTTIKIHQHIDFSQKILPLYYKHSNFSSFVRQVNMYGFRKITDIGGGGKHFDGEWEFYHPYFQRDHPEKVVLVKRKGQLKEDLKMTTPQLVNIFQDVEKLKHQNDLVEEKLKLVKTENERLWAEVFDLRERHTSQQAMIVKLIQFFLQLVMNKSDRPRKRRYPAEKEIQEKGFFQKRALHYQEEKKKMQIQRYDGASSSVIVPVVSPNHTETLSQSDRLTELSPDGSMSIGNNLTNFNVSNDAREKVIVNVTSDGLTKNTVFEKPITNVSKEPINVISKKPITDSALKKPIINVLSKEISKNNVSKDSVANTISEDSMVIENHAISDVSNEEIIDGATDEDLIVNVVDDDPVVEVLCEGSANKSDIAKESATNGAPTPVSESCNTFKSPFIFPEMFKLDTEIDLSYLTNEFFSSPITSAGVNSSGEQTSIVKKVPSSQTLSTPVLNMPSSALTRQTSFRDREEISANVDKISKSIELLQEMLNKQEINIDMKNVNLNSELLKLLQVNTEESSESEGKLPSEEIVTVLPSGDSTAEGQVIPYSVFSPSHFYDAEFGANADEPPQDLFNIDMPEEDDEY